MSDATEELKDFLARGLRLEDQGSYGEALQVYQEAHERLPDEAAPVHRMGVMYIRLEQRDAARQAFEEAIVLQHEYAPALTNLGNMALEAGDTEQAVQWYKRAIASQPEYPGAHHNLGVAYRRLGRLSDAVAEHRAATRHERRFSAEMDRLRLRGSKASPVASGCLGRSAGLLLFLSAGAFALSRLHI